MRQISTSILIVEDDAPFAAMLQQFLQRKGQSIQVVSSGQKAIALLESHVFHLIISDVRLPDMEGLALLQQIKQKHPNIPIILMTGYGDIRMAVRAIRMGAHDYLTKPIQPDELWELIQTHSNSQNEKTIETENLNSTPQTQWLPFESQVQMGIERVAPTDYSVLILGESGTGKEVTARAIHAQSQRASGPFIAIDCGALSPELSGSEFFGHVKGAFTGALHDKPGIFEQAHQGTVFLDEVGNLSYENQLKLLRILQEKKVKRLGSTHDKAVDIRIIAATNEDLSQARRNGQFREDLYHRLHEFSIYLPPLRERKQHILYFAHYFIAEAARQLHKQPPTLAPAAESLIRSYHWPGNFREMKNVMKRATLMASNTFISEFDLPLELRFNEPIIHTNPPANTLNTLNLALEKQTLEKARIEQVLTQTRFNKSKSAQILGIDRKTLYHKIKKYGL